MIAYLSLNFFDTNKLRKCTVTCEYGTIEWDYFNNSISTFNYLTNKKNVFCFEENIEETYEKEISHFINVVDSIESPKISLDEGLSTLKLIDAIRKSSEIGSKLNYS